MKIKIEIYDKGADLIPCPATCLALGNLYKLGLGPAKHDEILFANKDLVELTSNGYCQKDTEFVITRISNRLWADPTKNSITLRLFVDMQVGEIH